MRLFDELPAEMSVALEKQTLAPGFGSRSAINPAAAADDNEINVIHHRAPRDLFASRRPCRASKVPCMFERSIFR